MFQIQGKNWKSNFTELYLILTQEAKSVKKLKNV